MAAHNQREIDNSELFELLASISGYMDRELKFYALGGTALTILKIKRSTRDIDINIGTQKDYEYLCTIFEQIGFEQKGVYRWFTQEGLAFDLFHGSEILGTHLLPDCLDKAIFIQSFGNIKLYTLSLLDVIISKLARGDTRDLDDIRSIFKHEKIDPAALVKRYQETMEQSVVADAQQKLLDLIEIKFKEWKFKRDAKLIDEVKKWSLN